MLTVSEFANRLFDVAVAGPGRVGRIVPASWRAQTRASVLFGVGWREGGADDVAPGVGVEGVDVFVLGELDGLQKGLAEVGEGGGGSGFYLTLGDGGEELAQGSAKVASGEIAAGEAGRDIAAGLLGGGGLGFLAGVKRTEVRMVGAARGEALAAIGEGERTQRGTVLGAIGRHRDLQTKEIGFFKDFLPGARCRVLAGSERHF